MDYLNIHRNPFITNLIASQGHWHLYHALYLLFVGAIEFIFHTIYVHLMLYRRLDAVRTSVWHNLWKFGWFHSQLLVWKLSRHIIIHTSLSIILLMVPTKWSLKCYWLNVIRNDPMHAPSPPWSLNIPPSTLWWACLLLASIHLRLFFAPTRPS
jgi:hypothetical protein